MPKISKETSVCISISERPSNFGTTLFNEAFSADDLDFIYKAFGVEPNEVSLRDAIRGIRALGIRGCGVSMPFKIMSMKYMDSLDQSAKDVGALNTISNENGELKGYNTDYYGAREALGSIEDISGKSVLVLGSGGVTLAIVAALKSLGVDNVVIANRTATKAVEIANKWEYGYTPWFRRNEIIADILINATNIGMAPNTDELPIDQSALEGFGIIMDVVVSPAKTKMIQISEEMNKKTIPGYVMSLHQAVAQYKIYTGREAPREVMFEAMSNLLGI